VRDPNAFIPSRFLPPSPPPNRFIHLPFGAGPRVCVGAHFALVAATLALAKVIATFRVTLLDSKPVVPMGVITTQSDYSPCLRSRLVEPRIAAVARPAGAAP
jgi:cytochrome P450